MNDGARVRGPSGGRSFSKTIVPLPTSRVREQSRFSSAARDALVRARNSLRSLTRVSRASVYGKRPREPAAASGRCARTVFLARHTRPARMTRDAVDVPRSRGLVRADPARLGAVRSLVYTGVLRLVVPLSAQRRA